MWEIVEAITTLSEQAAKKPEERARSRFSQSVTPITLNM
jgi:hypothetical protein